MLHSQPIDWEVVDSYSVEPVRVYVEDDGAAIVRLAPHEIVGDYTFDMAPPAHSPNSAPLPHATRKSADSCPSRLKSYCSRRSSSNSDALHQKSHSAPRPALPERHSTTPSASRSLDRETKCTASPEEISNDHSSASTTPEGGSPKSKRLSLSLSFLKPQRRSSSSSAESSSGESDAGTSDGESEPPIVRPSRSRATSQAKTGRHPPSHSTTRPPVQVPAYKKSDLKRALIFARHELMKQIEMTGKNALVLEGWSITVLRQGQRYRIAVEYTGRPAIVSYPDGAPPSRVPPFLDVVDI